MEDIQELKDKVNASLAEMVRLILKQKKRIDSLEERLDVYNQKAGHKI